MRALDLCSGIGGFALGFERAGIETVAFCERDAYCRAVLRKHWPTVYCHKDITKVHGEGFRGIDIISAGFPCQPFSLAGPRRGTADDRHIWPEVFRIVRRAKPRWFIGENVPGLDDKREMVLDRVLDDLESADYETRTFEIPACGIDAPHKRARIVIVAYHTGEQIRTAGQSRKCGDVAHNQSIGRDQGHPDNRWHVQRNPAQSRSGHHGRSDVGNGHHDGRERQWLSHGSQWEQDPHFDWTGEEWIVCGDGKARRIKSGILLLAHGIPARMDRVKALGNAFVPQIAEEIGRAIISADSCY